MQVSKQRIPNLYQVVLLFFECFAEKTIQIPDVEDEVSGPKGMDLSRTPIELKSTEWLLKVVPWIGGRIISMRHFPSGKLIIH
jgi:alpha-glucosidase